ncbi:efflux RND transporter permease subunit [Phocaeicola oris]|uniref:efflux RND transporter permease subunit n=1 Tax=Phocaeicola oris TaxID=2896850 RepID=UPI00234F0F43|nr:efflux RND transporter permease subunit [Phocaeicola oris]MCE2617495.1 efflux RND transporter permease subunit [Phocaeicola oris]
MVKFLLQRPIAVLMAFLAFFIIGLVTYFALPVSLLPNIAIPQITVQVTGDNTSARELENTVVRPVRQQLLQVTGLKEIKSETKDGTGIIHLDFDFGTNTDLAFIEVNEKIDAAMNSLPKDVSRPKAIKASATDIPVFYLNMTLKNDTKYEETNEHEFLNMCELAENIVKRRIEQLPEVAIADITGVPDKQLQLVPNTDMLAETGITIEDIEQTLQDNNVEPGSMLVRDGYYEYNIRISAILHSEDDVKNIYIKKNDRLYQLKDLCDVHIVPLKETGRSLAGGKRAVTLAIIKQSEENMDSMKDQLKETTNYFASLYPNIDFSISRNQTELLDYTISNLQQNLILGLLLIFISAVLFLGDVRSPLIIGISMIVSIVITFFLFYIFKVSLNVISLSGLILAVGMMIDSSIIVTENISQYREKGYTLKRACDRGTSEMITPMLSSSLTTIAVFIPLVFLSGIAGVIFMDQAFSITSGLMISYITGIMLLPVLYLLFYQWGLHKKTHGFLFHKFNNKKENVWLDNTYNKGVNWVFSHKTICLSGIVVTILLCVFLFYFLPKERMPKVDQNELIARIEWNENIHIDENNRRVNALTKQTDKKVTEHTANVGIQNYLLNDGNELSSTEAELYFKTEKSKEIAPLQKMLAETIVKQYPHAIVTFSPPVTIFEKLFVTGEAELEAQLYPKNKTITPNPDDIQKLEKEINTPIEIKPAGIAFRNQISLIVNRDKLLLYNVDYTELTRTLKMAFKDNNISTLRSYQQYLPISIANIEKSINDILNETLIRTSGKEVNFIPLKELISIIPMQDLKQIVAGKNGEYIPLDFYNVNHVNKLMNEVKTTVDKNKEWDVDFSGSFFKNKQMINELVIILFISLLLMYFILCAQFESFFQPLIVLLEIPIDTAFALICLWLCGYTLNLMSAIGIIVTCGIVVNDSILKLDAINELRKTGMHLIDAIHTAGRRRLRAIIMTSLTTIFAMIPLMFSFDIGSELQKPLAVAMISSMALGTLVSLFIIPLIYWFIYKKYDTKQIY